jgi:Fe-S cluster assembly ATP-binding protein
MLLFAMPESVPREAFRRALKGVESMGILEVRNITLELGGKKILNDLTIDFWEGHIHALCGPNGAGKSTLASAIMGLPGYTHIGGDILLEGESLKGVSVDERARRGITLAWQEPARYEGLAVHRFISAGAKNKTRERVDEALVQVGLDPAAYRNRAVDKTLSGGERKRIELASILAMNPRIIMMDEPDSGIDVEALERIFQTLQILKANGTTIILITHSATVLRQAEHAFLMCSGTLIDKGSTEKIHRYFENKCIPCSHINQPLASELQ